VIRPINGVSAVRPIEFRANIRGMPDPVFLEKTMTSETYKFS
jgi:hypothetical protein